MDKMDPARSLDLQPVSIPGLDCPVCGGKRIQSLQKIAHVPVFCNVLWTTREAAKMAPRAAIELGVCDQCGHIFNLAFDSGRLAYDLDYENSLHFSARFQEYAAWLAKHLIERHDLRGKELIEIGSGKGDFLRLLVETGDNRGIGYDPSYQPTDEDTLDGRIQLIRGTFQDVEQGQNPDLIYSRHTLEHLEDPAGFMRNLRRTIGDRVNTAVFIEVPNVDLIVKDLSIWDIIYEHYSYFSEASLGYLMERTGFKVNEVVSTYQGQFLYVDASPTQTVETSLDRWTALREDRSDYLQRFPQDYRSKLETWTARLEDAAQQGKTVVIWGAGSKGVTFLNLLPNADTIRWVVDINPRKLGMFVSGAGQEIVHPDALRTIRPDMIVVMNPIYQDEIRNTVRSFGLEPEYLYA